MKKPAIFEAKMIGCVAFPEIAVPAYEAGGAWYLSTVCNAWMVGLG